VTDPSEANGASVEPVDWLSFSRWSLIRDCVLQGAFAMDDGIKILNRPTLATAVGTARHRVADFVSQRIRLGESRPSAAWVRENFGSALRREHELLVKAWAPATVPNPRHWPGVNLVAASLVQTLADPDGVDWPPPRGESTIVERRAAHAFQRPSSSAPTPPGPGDSLSEAQIVDETRHLFGRLDRLENRQGSLVVVELKSAIGVPRERLSDRFREQLLFYAGLVQASYGEWPILEVHPIGERPLEIAYTTIDVDLVRRRAVHARDVFNRLDAGAAVVSTATPSSDVCQSCPFRVACPPFAAAWRAVNASSSQRDSWRLSLVRGEVASVSQHAKGLRVDLDQAVDYSAPMGRITVIGLPADLRVEVGQTFAVSGVTRANSERVLRATWDSTYWPVNGM
jgi:hypothetical protein